MLIGRAASSVIAIVDPTVDWNGQLHSTTRNGQVCFSAWKNDNDGGKYVSNNAGAFVAGAYKTWLTAGGNSQVWIERTIITGSLATDFGAGRQLTNGDKVLMVLDAVATGSPSVATVTIDYWDAASGGNNLATGLLTLRAERL